MTRQVTRVAQGKTKYPVAGWIMARLNTASISMVIMMLKIKPGRNAPRLFPSHKDFTPEE